MDMEVLNPRKILFIDDDETRLLTFSARFANNHDWEIYYAENASQAKTRLAMAVYDVIMWDGYLGCVGGLDGIDIADWVVANKLQGAALMVVHSGNAALNETIVECFQEANYKVVGHIDGWKKIKPNYLNKLLEEVPQ